LHIRHSRIQKLDSFIGQPRRFLAFLIELFIFLQNQKMASVEERNALREGILAEFRELQAKAQAVALKVDQGGEVLGGTTQEKAWNIVKAIEEADANLTKEISEHP
jgi:hypothetical protein